MSHGPFYIGCVKVRKMHRVDGTYLNVCRNSRSGQLNAIGKKSLHFGRLYGPQGPQADIAKANSIKVDPIAYLAFDSALSKSASSSSKSSEIRWLICLDC